MSLFDDLEWDSILEQFIERRNISKQLIELHLAGSIEQYAELAVGLNDSTGNYSANQYGLGGPILERNRNARPQIFRLAGEFKKLTSGRKVPEIVKAAQIAYLGISVGSEISCMINPAICWVANTRTAWTHLVIELNDNVAEANVALMGYRTSDADSKMAYKIWEYVHAQLETSMTRLYEMGLPRALEANIDPSSAKYLWADAIANHLYDLYAERS